jgi:hypothetical protein
MIKGKHPAACFMDVPFALLKNVLTPGDADPQSPRYEPYGIAVTKRYAYERSVRPVFYLSNEELDKLRIPQSELWRVVRLEVSEEGWICWLHERERRCKGDFVLTRIIQAAFVRTTKGAQKLAKALASRPEGFKCRPRSVNLMTVLCQGLLK